MLYTHINTGPGYFSAIFIVKPNVKIALVHVIISLFKKQVFLIHWECLVMELSSYLLLTLYEVKWEGFPLLGFIRDFTVKFHHYVYDSTNRAWYLIKFKILKYCFLFLVNSPKVCLSNGSVLETCEINLDMI